MKPPPARSVTSAWLMGAPSNWKSSRSLGSGILAMVSRYLIKRACFSLIIGRVDLLRLAGLPVIRDIYAPPDGCSADLRPSLCAIYDGGDRRRGRPRRPRSHQRPAQRRQGNRGSPRVCVELAPAPSSQLKTLNPNIPPVRKKLGADDSAAITAQLIQEIETLPDDELQPRAIGILKAKNRLSANDAQLVENAFAAKMAQQGALPDALTTDEGRAAPTDPEPQPALAPKDTVKPLRPRGRPRKIKAAAERPAAPPVLPKPTIDDSSPASTHHQADAIPAKIQKSELTISEPRRHRDKTHLKFVASQPSLVCGRSLADAPSAVHSAPRTQSQGQRRIHCAAVSNPSSGQPSLWRRGGLVG
jgi:hypothetical protein